MEQPATFGSPLRSLNMRSVMLAANNGGLYVEDAAQEQEPVVTPDPTPEVTPEPTHQPGIQDIVKQIISDFVRLLFGSIARLFGN